MSHRHADAADTLLPVIAGADGCRGGWLVITEQDGDIRALRTVKLGDLFSKLPQLQIVAVDIPIGITEHGARDCDDEARRFLASRGSCVFPTPVRATFEAETYPEALQLHREADGRGMSKQAFYILPKIKQVDEFIQSSGKGDNLFEAHPEVSFCAMNGNRLIRAPKTSKVGLATRIRLVEDNFGKDAYPKVRAQFLPSQAKDDDILDAFATLWTARRIQAGTEMRFPEQVIRDSHGIPMQIHC